jgi:hypothetical protein
MNKDSFTISKEVPTFNDYMKEIKTEFIIGDVHYYTAKKFNWFNRLMMKLVFGWEVRRINESNRFIK